MIKRKTFCIRKRPTWSLKRAFTLYTGHRFGTWVDRRLNRALVHFIAGARTVFKKTTSTLTCLWSPWKYCCLHLEFERTLNILLHTKQRSYHSVLRGKSWSDNCPADRLWQSCFSPGIDSRRGGLVAADYTIIIIIISKYLLKDQGHSRSPVSNVWPRCMISEGNHVKFARFVFPGPPSVSEDAKTWLPGLLR